jgi:O-antigen ligase
MEDAEVFGSFETLGVLPAARDVGAQERVALVLERISFFGLLSMLLLAAIPYGTVQQWWIALVDCLIFILCSFRVVEAMLRRQWTIGGASMLIPLFALCCFAAAQTIPLGVLRLSTISTNSWRTITTDPHETQRFVFRLLALILTGEALLHYTTTRRRLWAVVIAVVGIGGASACFGIVRQVAQSDPSSFVLPDLVMGESYGQFINRNHFALLMEMTLGLLMGLILGRSKSGGRFLPYVALALLVWAALVFSNSRGGLIGMLGLIVFSSVIHFAIVRWRSMKRKGFRSRNRLVQYGVSALLGVGLCVGLILMTAMGISWVGGDAVMTHIEKTSGEVAVTNDSQLRRKEIWQASWQLFRAHPIAGIGYGGYGTAITEFTGTGPRRESLQQAHNDYLEMLASGGLIGAAFVVWFMVALVRKARRHLQPSHAFRYGTCLGALTGLFAVSIHSFFDFGLHITVNALMFTFLVVIATATYRGDNGIRDPARRPAY